MSTEKQASLAECNALFHRQALPLTFGTDDEKKAAAKVAKTADMDALKKAKDDKADSEALFADLVTGRHFAELTGAQAAACPTIESMCAEILARAPVDDGLTPEQREAVAAAKALGV